MKKKNLIKIPKKDEFIIYFDKEDFLASNNSIDTEASLVSDTPKLRRIFLFLITLSILSIILNIFWLEMLTKIIIPLNLILIVVVSFEKMTNLLVEMEYFMKTKDFIYIKNKDSFRVFAINLNGMQTKITFIIVGLLLYCIANIFLSFDATFGLSLFFFLVTQYFLNRFLLMVFKEDESLERYNLLLSVPLLIYVGFVLYYVLPMFQNNILLQIIITIYQFSLAFSVFVALCRYSCSPLKSYIYTLIGVIFLVVFNLWDFYQISTLKINMWHKLGINISYILGLYFMVEGLIDEITKRIIVCQEDKKRAEE